MFKTLLATADRAGERVASVETAACLAESVGGRLRILHVLDTEHPDELHRQAASCKAGDAISGRQTRAAKRLGKIYRDLIDRLPETEIRVAVGRPWAEILRCARETETDLILMGPHGSLAGPSERLAGRVGGTVQGVVTREICPVMIVNRPLCLSIAHLRNIMVGIDFSASCECALCFAVRLAAFCGARVFAFHMLPIPPYPKYARSDFETDRAEAAERLTYFCREYMGNLPHETIVKGGVLPHVELLGGAVRIGADLIVLGTHTGEQRGRWYPGSVVEQVSLQSVCPVVVINAPDALQPWEGECHFTGDGSDRRHRPIRVFSKKINPSE